MAQETLLYTWIEKYAKRRGMRNTLIALPLAQELLANAVHQGVTMDPKAAHNANSFDHCLKATKLLMDLHIMLRPEEEDLLLASMLCHDLLQEVEFPEALQELVAEYQLDPRVLAIVRIITRPALLSDEGKKQYYKNLQEHKLAVLVALADRCNLVEQLAGLTISEVNDFIDETRTYMLPLCVYAKQHYGDVHMSVHIMMEKIRNLMNVSDIIAKRYQKRETAYTEEILILMEENARLRRMIRQFEQGEYEQ